MTRVAKKKATARPKSKRKNLGTSVRRRKQTYGPMRKGKRPKRLTKPKQKIRPRRKRRTRQKKLKSSSPLPLPPPLF
jgi:hypothetical protein